MRKQTYLVSSQQICCQAYVSPPLIKKKKKERVMCSKNVVWYRKIPNLENGDGESWSRSFIKWPWTSQILTLILNFSSTKRNYWLHKVESLPISNTMFLNYSKLLLSTKIIDNNYKFQCAWSVYHLSLPKHFVCVCARYCGKFLTKYLFM